MKSVHKLYLAVLLLTGVAYGAATRVIDADQIKSSNHTKTWSLPSATDTLVGRASTDTLTNKTLSSATISGTTTGTGTLIGADGSVSAPFYSFSSETNTGLYRRTASTLGISVAGTEGIDVVNIGGGLVNVGVGQAANGTAYAPFAVTRNQNSDVYAQFNNPSTGTSSSINFQLVPGTASGRGLLLSAYGDTYNGNTFLNQKTSLHSDFNMLGLVLGSDYSGGDIEFTIGTPSTAHQVMTVDATSARLRKGLTLGIDGATSGTLTLAVPTTVTSHTLTLPSAQGAASTVLTNDGSGGLSWTAPASAPSTSYEISNCSIATSVSGNALTVALKDSSGSDPSGGSPCKIGFRSATAATGTYTQVSTTAAVSVVVSSGSTLGCVNATACTLYIYAVYSGSAVVLGVANDLLVDEGSVYTTTALAGSGADDARTTLYTTATQTSKPLRLLGRVTITEATAGTWASNATEISNVPFTRPPINPTFFVHRNAVTQSISNGSDTKVQWTTEAWDTNNNFDNATNYRFTPTVAGKYLLSATIQMTATVSTDRVAVKLRKNGSEACQSQVHASTTPAITATVTCLQDANGSTDYFEVFVIQNSGSTQNLAGDSFVTNFSGARIP